MKYTSLFSGIEAASVAWEPLGWEPLLFSEVDPFASAVLESRFPDVPNLGDITKIDWKKAVRRYGKSDVVVGGSPCQSFSIAGNREGLEGESGLMWEYVRAVCEIRPEWCVWENVPGALSSTHGEDFGCLLRELDALGYGLAWRVLDAQFFGVAQRRERLFLVGHLGDPEGPCEVLFERESLRWDTPSSKDKRKELTANARASIVGTSSAELYENHPQDSRVKGPLDTAPTVAKYYGTGGGNVPIVRNAYCLQGNMIGRGDKNGPQGCGINDDIAFTLNTVDRHAVVAIDCRNDAVNYEIGGTLQAKSNGGQSLNYINPVMQSSIVRRLTPRECERLQGFPDDWTRVPYRGKQAEECPDTPRYKAIGNSMAVPVMRWIGERIAQTVFAKL